jgi:hypothetical protein
MRILTTALMLLALLPITGCAAAPPPVAPAAGAAAPLAGVSAADEAAVIALIDRLFDGMRARDSSVVRAAMHPQARHQSVASRDGISVVQSVPIDAFVSAVGASRAEPWDERISRPVVQVDGDLASAWMNYSFYRGTQFSHCGVNAMQLHRGPEGWKIIQIADTRRTAGCGPVQER